MDLRILSAGAAQGLVRAMERDFREACGLGVSGAFGAVGAMREKFLAGEPCDVLVLTDAMLRELAGDGRVLADTLRPLGRVRTGVAVPAGAPRPAIDDAPALRAALSAASAIHFPDPQRATAGIHFMKVLGELGLEQALAARLRPHPNGATAMRELAAAGDARAIGCTQITEIRYTAGVALVGPLPRQFELATVYSVAVAAGAVQPHHAQQLVELLAGPEAAERRVAGGFE